MAVAGGGFTDAANRTALRSRLMAPAARDTFHAERRLRIASRQAGAASERAGRVGAPDRADAPWLSRRTETRARDRGSEEPRDSGFAEKAALNRRLSPPWVKAALVVGLLYLFLVGVASLEAGIKALGADFQEGLLDSVDNPVAGLFAGILATVLVQSSSASTSTIVGLVGSGTLTVDAAVPMILGANIGTTITSTIVSLGSIRRSEEFRRAFAGATMHDFFNVMAVITFLPLQIATGFLSKTANWLADRLGGNVEGGKTRSPVKELVKEPVSQIKSLFESATDNEQLVGVLLIVIGMVFIFVALAFITRNMRQLVAGRMERALNTAVARGSGIVGIVTGTIATFAVQSSSITTSILVPLVGSGVLRIRNAYPITLGANLGTTVTALLASLAVDLRAGLVVALTHTLFNLSAIALFYPIPAVRYIPVRLAEGLAGLAVARPAIVAVYVLGAFVITPLAGIILLR